MATLTVYGELSDGMVSSTNTSYSLARSGSGLSVNNTMQYFYVGQMLSVGNSICREGFSQYDTSSIGAGATVTAVAEHLYLYRIYAQQGEWSDELRLYDWGDTLDTGDWVPGASLGNYTLLQSLSSSSMVEDAYNAFTGASAFINAVNKTGFTRLLHNSSDHRLNIAVIYMNMTMWFSADAEGTTKDPKLVIEYTVPVLNKVNIGGVWKDITGVWCNINGVWKSASGIFVNVNGVWKS